MSAVLWALPAFADPRGTVSGRVLDATTGRPIADAHVSIFSARALANGPENALTLRPIVTTRSDGSFEVIAIEDDRIVVAIDRSGFPTIACPYVLSPGGETRVTFRLRNEPSADACPAAPVGGGQTQDVYIVR